VGQRLFVALEPPPDVRQELARAAAELGRRLGAGRDAFRWVEPEALHVTLSFLGNVADDRIAEVRRAVAGAAARARPHRLEVCGAGAFPSARRPAVLWAGLQGETAPLARLVADLAAALAAVGFPAEDRPFHPHVTLARARGRGARSVEAALAGFPAEPFPWAVEELALFRSHLSPRGARYEALLRAPLGVAAAPDDHRPSM